MKLSNALHKLLLACAAFVCLVTSQAHALELSGAGATSATNLLQSYASNFLGGKNTHLDFKYSPVGTDSGMHMLNSREVDFVVSDYPFSREELAKNGLMQFPFTTGAIVPFINVPGIPADKFKLDGETLANIFIGKIHKWNDPDIQNLNLDLKLPDENIKVFYRLENSGSSLAITGYLSRSSKQWKERVGQGRLVAWPVGSGVKGVQGMLDAIASTDFSIGYANMAQAVGSKIAAVQLHSQTGRYFMPNSSSIAEAARMALFDSSLGTYSMPGDKVESTGWPIIFVSYIIIKKDPPRDEHAKQLLKFIDRIYRDGAKTAADMGYAPLPDTIVGQSRNTWRLLCGDDGRSLWNGERCKN